jgi:hypothetical protein
MMEAMEDGERLTEEFTVRMTPGMKARIVALARREKRKPADMVRILLDEALAAQEEWRRERQPHRA